jgi:hypothetical protein
LGIGLLSRRKIMTLAEKEPPELTTVQTAISGLLTALAWEYPREKIPSEPRWDPHTVVYPREIADIMEVVKAGRCNTISPDIELPCGEIAGLNSAWAQSVPFALLSYDEGRQSEAMVDSWMTLTPNAALSAHTLIQEDGPKLPKAPGPQAEEGGEILEGVFAEGCESLQDATIYQGRAGGLGTVSGTSPDPAGIVSKDPRVAPT